MIHDDEDSGDDRVLAGCLNGLGCTFLLVVVVVAAIAAAYVWLKHIHEIH